MESELHGKFMINHAWEYVTVIPAGRKVMKGRWPFSVKYNDDGSIKLFKARWVGCGYSQVPGIDFHETYGSTLPITPCRLFFAVACINDWEILEIDTIRHCQCLQPS